ncbi:ISL3 family transposase [Agrobacterium vitis]|uniref:ISL3 family transposase n=1 Tax=Agrobacterium vitis TaxID=373 RepID=UPI0018D211F0|nr:ISL3 family transposase [Agrobacterium vitis]
MPNRLNLPGYTVLTDPTNDDVHAEFNALPDTCPECGSVGRLHRWGKRDMTITDTPNFGKRSRFTVTRVRLKCMECQHTFMQPLPGIDDKRRMTTRAVEYIVERGLRHTYAYLAEEFAVDPKTIANIVIEAGDALEEFPPWSPHYLGIDEVMVDGDYCCIFTDIGNRQIIDFLSNRRKATVKRWLRRLVNPERIQAVTIDMWKDYRDAVYAVLGPSMPIVVDKFHVTSKADKAVEAVRVKMNREASGDLRRHMKRSREILTANPKELSAEDRFLLSGWLRNFPVLNTAYETSRSFKFIYSNPTKATAERALDEWLRNMPEEVKDQFDPLLSAIEGWRPQIMNYFDHPITNAFTESMNKKVKSIAREGVGYKFPMMRRRILEGYRPKPAKGYLTCEVCGKENNPHNRVKQKMLLPPRQAATSLEHKLPILVCESCFQAHK